MARHGLFHNSMGNAHKSNQTPHIALALSSSIAFLVPASLHLFGVKPFDGQGYFGTICTYGFLLVYVLVAIAAPFYLYRIRKLRPVDIMFSVLAVGFMILPIVGTVGIPGSSLFPVPAPPQNVFPYLFLLYLVAGCGWFVILRFRSPRLVKSMALSIAAIDARFSDEQIN